MAVGIDADTERLSRGSIPGSGNAGRLCDGGYKNTFQGVWVYRPSSTTTYALTAGGSVIHMTSGPREVHLGFNSVGAVLADLRLNIIFNSGGGAGSDQTFSGHAGNSFLDEWVYYFHFDNATTGQTAGYVRLADMASPVTITRANDNATSQYITTLTIGNAGTSACVLGHYAYARARFASGIVLADVLAAAADSAPIAGDWGFWPLDNNTDNLDDSGNTRNLTFTGTLTSETSPTLGGGGPTAYTLDADPGAVSLAGTAAGLESGRLLAAGAGSYALAGTAAAVEVGRAVVAASGAVAVSGTAAAVRATRVLAAEAGSVALAGTAAVPKAARLLSTEPGAFSVAGTDADLVAGTPGAYLLDAEPGAVVATGSPAALLAGRELSALAAAYAVAGTNAGLKADRKVVASPGAWSLAGTDAALAWSGELTASLNRVVFDGVVVRRRVVAGGVARRREFAGAVTRRREF